MDGDFAAYDSNDGGNYAFVGSPDSYVGDQNVSTISTSSSIHQSKNPSHSSEYSTHDIDISPKAGAPKFDDSNRDSYPSQQNITQQQRVQQQQHRNDMQSPSYQSGNNQSQTDADRQAMFTLMQEQFQMQQDSQHNSLMDRCWQRRKDILKLVVMSLVILLALSSHSVVLHYVKCYVEDTTLTPWTEFAFRASYPISVVLLIWMIKGAQTQVQRA